MSRMVGTVSMGIRAPIIRSGDDLVEIVSGCIMDAVKEDGLVPRDRDVVAMTEAIVARAQGNYCTVDDIAEDVRAKLGGETIGVMFPILSRNRFAICLRGIAKGAKKVVLMLSYPSDEVGNHLVDLDMVDEKGVDPYQDVLSLEQYRELFGYCKHPFTGVDYVEYYGNLIRESGAEVEIIFANNPRAILNYTKNVLTCDIHTRERTKRILKAAGAERVLGLELVDVEAIKNVANSVGGVNAYISCIGSLVQPLDLLPEELRGVAQKKKNKRERKSDSIKVGVIICVLLSVLGIGLAGFAVIRYKSAQNEQARLEQRIQELDHVRVTAETYETYLETEAALNQIRAYSQTNNTYLVDFLEELERKMPSALLLMSAVCDEEGVTMNMVTPGMEEADVIISQLRKFESIKHLEVSTITESTDEGGLSSATFSVRCAYNAPETEAPAGEAPVEDVME